MWTWAWTAIWAVLAFVLLLVHGDAILTFAAEQLDQRRAHRLQLEQERTKQAPHSDQARRPRLARAFGESC
jgi:hypothetical protein